jgi:hypothetical protein
MTTSAPPPGGPLPSDFRDAISALAEQAREENRRRKEESRKRAERRTASRVIKIGLVLVGLEVISLGVLYGTRLQRITRIAPPVRALSRNDCASVAHRTYWKVVAYIKDKDRAPASLGELVPNYLDRLPLDSATGKPLEYSTDGTHFDLRCPSQAARK